MSRNKVLFAFAFLSCTFLVYLYQNNETTDKPEKSFSTYAAAAKVNRNISASPAHVLFASQVKKTKAIENRVSLKLKTSYFTSLDQHPLKLSSDLPNIEKKHARLLETMRKEGYKIDRIVQMKPKLAIVLSVYLNIPVSKLHPNDLNTLELTNKDWYLIKRFSESNDFKLMLKRDTLTNDYVQLENLSKIYENTNSLK